ncbi:MAG: sugar ABC transporter ATP-binding protein [Lachnospiraceae bacterium]|nr:sugar ABC transporter ATP-binding protein [Lachnospiraceae bacterium]
MGNMLEMKQIRKEFSGVPVLNGVDFAVGEGEIRALLGANGAGKSTLMKILCGVYHATSGDVLIDGRKAEIKSPLQAAENGIAIVHQELSMIPPLTILENFFLGKEIRKYGLLQKARMREEYFRVCNELDFHIDPDVKTRDVSVAKQQMVEIMKCIHANARIIIFDEPTTSLTDDEKKTLFEVILKLKQQKKTIIYISHILEEIFLLADTVSIMRNGDMVGTFPKAEMSIPIISEHMSGKKYVEGQRLTSHCRKEADPLLRVEHLSAGNGTKDVSFTVRPGEVVGLAGLVGAGRSEIVRSIFGADSKTAGRILVDGREVKISHPAHAIAAGIGLIPEDRKREGVILKHEIYKNATLIQLKKMRQMGMLQAAREKSYTEQAIKRLSVKVPSLTAPVMKLSGGNQQKIVVSKWLDERMKVLIFDEPTKGIDVGAKEDIFRTVEDFAKAGMAIIFISSDLNEVIRTSDRILVVRGGQILKDVDNNNMTQKDIMEIILQ